MGDFMDTLGKVGKGVGKLMLSSFEGSLEATARTTQNPELREYAKNSAQAMRNIKNGEFHFNSDDED